jgi:hypothetical protein
MGPRQKKLGKEKILANCEQQINTAGTFGEAGVGEDGIIFETIYLQTLGHKFDVCPFVGEEKNVK